MKTRLGAIAIGKRFGGWQQAREHESVAEAAVAVIKNRFMSIPFA